LTHRVVREISVDGKRFPLHVITLGNPDRSVPAVGFFGGVHGLERIGSSVLLHYLRGLVMQLKWDRMLQQQLESLRRCSCRSSIRAECGAARVQIRTAST